MTSQSKLSADQMAQIAIANLPLWEALLRDVRHGDGGLSLPELFASHLLDDDANQWARLYVDQASFNTLYARLGQLAIKNSDYSVLPLEFWQATVVKYCDFLSLMSFGESIFHLVKRAQNGDDTAFFQAVRVDKTTLYAIPYFRQRQAKAQLGSDSSLLKGLSTAIKSPSLGSKIKHPILLLFFAMLDDSHLLDMPLNDLLDLCETVGVYGAEYGIEDRDSLRKRRSYYRRRCGRQITN